jgi:hypothetical protein
MAFLCTVGPDNKDYLIHWINELHRSVSTAFPLICTTALNSKMWFDTIQIDAFCQDVNVIKVKYIWQVCWVIRILMFFFFFLLFFMALWRSAAIGQIKEPEGLHCGTRPAPTGRWRKVSGDLHLLSRLATIGNSTVGKQHTQRRRSFTFFVASGHYKWGSGRYAST